MNYMDMMAEFSHRPATEEELAQINANTIGLDKNLGTVYTHIENGRVEATLEYRNALVQPVGIIHGGTYAALAESLGSVAGFIAAGKPVVGVNNSTDFISSVKEGTITGVATPIQLGRRTQLWNIEMRQKDKLVARTTLRTMVV